MRSSGDRHLGSNPSPAAANFFQERSDWLKNSASRGFARGRILTRRGSIKIECPERAKRRGVGVSMLYFVYILKCADKSLYVGCTNNLERRLYQHNGSKGGAHYTKVRRPVTLQYSEVFSNLADARKREAEIKRWKREKKIELMGHGGNNS